MRKMSLLLVTVILASTLLLTAFVPVMQRSRGGFSAAIDSWVRNGFDIIFYSDELSTETIHLEGAEGSITFAGDLVPEETSLVVTDTTVVVPLSMNVVMTSTGAAALSAASSITTTGISPGQILILRNGNASDAITVDGVGGTVDCKANVILGADDTLLLYMTGTEWHCLSTYDNS